MPSALLSPQAPLLRDGHSANARNQSRNRFANGMMMSTPSHGV